MKLKQLMCLATLSTALSTPFNTMADTLSISFGGGAWNDTPDGYLQKTTDPAAVDLKNNFFWEKESQTYLFVTVEHFIPILPNVRLMHTSLNHDGSGNTDFIFNGQNFNGDIKNNFDIETLDLVAYYEVLDNIVSLDLGLNIRNLKAEYTIRNSGPSVTDTIDETVPMLYALVGVSPWPDLIISGEMSYLAFSGSSISDFTAKIAYTTDFFVGIEAGYRKQEFKFDDLSDHDARMTFDGVFAGAYLKF